MIIRITNKGAVNGIKMFLTFLTILSSIKMDGKVKNINQIKDYCLNELEKMDKWLDREDDKTISKDEIKIIRKEYKGLIKYIKKVWKD
jgi:hypothetical protein